MLEPRPGDGRVALDLYYEVLCPDSRSFILRQLYPAWEEVRDTFIINFIPYGKARTYRDETGDYAFSCQHGPTECQGNIYHACSNNYIQDTALKLDFIRCMMLNNYSPRSAVERCGAEHGVDISSILACGDGAEGPQLHAHAGQLTHKLRPKMTFVPTIELNGLQRNQRQILTNLKSKICKLYKGDSLICKL